LQLGVVRCGTAGEYVEDELAPVDHLELGERSDVVDLPREELLVEDEGVGAHLLALDHDLLDLALPDEVLRVQFLGPLDHDVDGVETGRAAEVLQLGDALLQVLVAPGHDYHDKERLLFLAPRGDKVAAPLADELALELGNELGEVHIQLVDG